MWKQRKYDNRKKENKNDKKIAMQEEKEIIEDM